MLRKLALISVLIVCGTYVDSGYAQSLPVSNQIDSSPGNTSQAKLTASQKSGVLVNIITLILEDTADASLPLLMISDASSVEGDNGTRSLMFTVTLSAASDGTVTFNYTTQDDTAISGQDYLAASDTVTIPAGNTSTTLNVEINGDETVEQNEQFLVVLSNPVGANLGDASAVGLIINDDQSTLPQLSINDRSISEGDSGAQDLTFTVSLSVASASAVTVDYATQNGSAVAGEDYVGADDTLTLPAGDTSTTFSVAINGDELVEGDEQFSVMLSNPHGATLSDAIGLGRIVDDDAEQSDYGLDARPTNTNCLATGVSSSADISLQAVFSNYPLNGMVTGLENFISSAGASHWVYTLQSGEVGWFNPSDTSGGSRGVLLNLDVTEGETEAGLLGLALDPEFLSNGYLYLSFNEDPSPGEQVGGGIRLFNSVIARFTVDMSNPNSYTLVPGSRLDIFKTAQPWGNHNGGAIHFGPLDGYLYFGLGDGGLEAGMDGQSQNTDTFLGSIIRIDVHPTEGSNPYSIPPDNPFVNGGGRPEIWAYGFRNPWRWSFDRDTGDLWLGNVGERDWEEVEKVERGTNHGWPCREGAHPGPQAHRSFCQGKSFVEPIFSYLNYGQTFEPGAQTYGASIAAGYVYRGTQVPELNGAFVFGDVYSSYLWAAFPSGNGQYQIEILTDTSTQVANFAQDTNGEIYLYDYINGVSRRIIANGNTSGSGPALLLSDSGCVNPDNPSEFDAGVIPYDINEPFWSDGAQKDRYMALPDGEQITIAANGDLSFPVGSVLIKEFRLNDKLFETRLLMHQQQNLWEGFSYRWNADGSDAALLNSALVENVEGQSWSYPSRAQCLSCHTASAGYALGPELKQLNREMYYPSTGRTASQLDTWEHIGLFERNLTTPEKNAALVPSRNNPGADTNARARSYLHSNCAQCHRGPGGPALGTNIDFREHISFTEMQICDTEPQRGDLGITDAKLLKPGVPSESVLYVRLSNNDSKRMPPLGSNQLDHHGHTLIEQWIQGISECP